jgi:hypothetical protein
MGLRGTAVEPGGSTLPQVLRRVVQVPNARGRGRELLLEQAPHPPSTSAAPDHLGRGPDALAQRFEPETRLEGIDIPHDGHEPALRQPRAHLPGPRAMLAYPGESPHFDLTPADLPTRRARIGPKWPHHASGPQGQGQGGLRGRQRLGWRLGPLGDGGQGLLEVLHRLVTSRLHPTPHGAGADGATPGPAQQSGGGGKRHKDRERTAQTLEFRARPLMRRHPQQRIERGDLRDVTPVRTSSDAASPPERPEQAHELALGKALTAQRGAAARAGGPGVRPLGTFGEHVCDDVEGQDTRSRPHGQDELRERLGLFDRPEQRLHGGIIRAYAVAEA